MQGWEMAAYESLRTEILRSAVKDYQKALRKSNREGAMCDEQLKMEKWFLSKWGQALSGDSGEYIIEHCRKHYKKSEPTPARKRQGIPDDEQKKIYKEYIDGVGKMAILQRYKISSYTLYKIVKRWG